MLFRAFKLCIKKRFGAIPSFSDRLKKLREGMSDVVKPFPSKCRSAPEEIAV